MEPQNIKMTMEEFRNNPCLKDRVISTNDSYIKVSNPTLEVYNFYKLFYGDLIKTEPNTTQKNKNKNKNKNKLKK